MREVIGKITEVVHIKKNGILFRRKCGEKRNYQALSRPEFGIIPSCKALGMHPSTYYYKSDASEKQQDILIRNEIDKIIELLTQSGYRSVTVILNRTIKITVKGWFLES